AQVALVGDPALVLEQLLAAAERQGVAPRSGSPWLGEVATVRDNFDRMLDEREQRHHAAMPIHPDRLARELCRVMDPDATLILDSFTMSGWVTQWFKARFP